MENYPAHTTQPNRWIKTETMKTIHCIEVNHIIFFVVFILKLNENIKILINAMAVKVIQWDELEKRYTFRLFCQTKYNYNMLKFYFHQVLGWMSPVNKQYQTQLMNTNNSSSQVEPDLKEVQVKMSTITLCNTYGKYKINLCSINNYFFPYVYRSMLTA